MDDADSSLSSVIESPTETEVAFVEKVVVVPDPVLKDPWVLKDGVYTLDFTEPPSFSSNWEIHKHKGGVFNYNPIDTTLFSLKDLGLKDGATIEDCVKKLKRLKMDSMPANTADFIFKVKPVLPTDFSGTYIYFLDTIFKGSSLLVRFMYYNDHKNEWVIKHDPIKKELGQFSRIACY